MERSELLFTEDENSHAVPAMLQPWAPPNRHSGHKQGVSMPITVRLSAVRKWRPRAFGLAINISRRPRSPPSVFAEDHSLFRMHARAALKYIGPRPDLICAGFRALIPGWMDAADGLRSAGLKRVRWPGSRAPACRRFYTYLEQQKDDVKVSCWAGGSEAIRLEPPRWPG